MILSSENNTGIHVCQGTIFLKRPALGSVWSMDWLINDKANIVTINNAPLADSKALPKRSNRLSGFSRNLQKGFIKK